MSNQDNKLTLLAIVKIGYCWLKLEEKSQTHNGFHVKWVFVRVGTCLVNPIPRSKVNIKGDFNQFCIQEQDKSSD